MSSGFQEIMQTEREILSVLIPRVSEKGSAITYGDLSREIESRFGVHHNPHTGFSRSLGRIQAVCRVLGLPCISSMVVNRKWEPGGGFYDEYRRVHPEYAGDSDREIRKREQASCRECRDWSLLVVHYGLEEYTGSPSESMGDVSIDSDVVAVGGYGGPLVLEPAVQDEVVCLAVGETYELVLDTGITAHPVGRPYPSAGFGHVVPIKKGGALEQLFKVTRIVECLPGTVPELALSLSSEERKQLLSYHRGRLSTFGYNRPAGDPYRFYIMSPVARIVSPAEKKYVQIAARIALDDMVLDWMYDEEAEDGAFELESVVRGGAEGKRVAYYTTKYERDPKNRAAAIRAHGTTCQVCGFDFAKVYGKLGEGFIEVHHVKPLYSLEEELVPDPKNDLVCLCSNCHRMIHRKVGCVLTVKELRAILDVR